MPRDFRTRSILARAAAGLPLFAYTPDGDGGGGGGDDKPGDDGKLTLTQAELDQRIAAATEAAAKAERDRAVADRQREKEEAERKKAEEQGEYQKVAQQEEAKRKEAEARAAAAERRALLADVNVQLRDHLAATDALKPFLGNAPDIMLHVEKKLGDDAKPDDIAKLIDAEAKSFAARTTAGKGAAGGAPAGGQRGKLPAGQHSPETRQPPARQRGRFSTLNYHG